MNSIYIYTVYHIILSLPSKAPQWTVRKYASPIHSPGQCQQGLKSGCHHSFLCIHIGYTVSISVPFPVAMDDDGF